MQAEEVDRPEATLAPPSQRLAPNHRPHRPTSRSGLTASSRIGGSALLKRKLKSQATRTGHNHEKVASALFSCRNALGVWRSQDSRRREAWQSRREVGDAFSWRLFY
jgi:hypothetical protein